MRLFLNPDMALSLTLTLFRSPTLPLSGALSESFDTALTLLIYVVLVLLGERRRA